jgi:hypothetical protein
MHVAAWGFLHSSATLVQQELATWSHARGWMGLPLLPCYSASAVDNHVITSPSSHARGCMGLPVLLSYSGSAGSDHMVTCTWVHVAASAPLLLCLGRSWPHGHMDPHRCTWLPVLIWSYLPVTAVCIPLDPKARPRRVTLYSFFAD